MLSQSTKNILIVALADKNAGEEISNSIDQALEDSGSSGESGWVKYSVDYTDMAVASTNTVIDLGAVEAGVVIREIFVIPTQAFQGTLLTSLTSAVSTVEVEDIHANGYNLISPLEPPCLQNSNRVYVLIPTTLSVFISTSAEENLDQLTQGSFDVYVRFTPVAELVP